MRTVSSLFRQTMEDRRDFYATAEITFADGDSLSLEKNDFTMTGSSIVESGGTETFPLGLLVGRYITISLMNDDERWSKYDFFGAQIRMKISFDLTDGSTESLNIGKFTVVSPESYGETVVVTAMDDSYKADKTYTTSRSYPMTASEALRDACDTCDIELGTPAFANDDFLIQSAPSEEITFRQFIGCVAMIAGGNAVMDDYNRLTIKSYDFSAFERFGVSYNGGTFDVLSDTRYLSGDAVSGGSFNPWDTGDQADGGAFGDRDDLHVLYQFSDVPVIEADDVVITGVRLMSANEDGTQTPHLNGTEGYVLDLENPLAAGKEDSAVALIGEKIVGLRFRPFSGEHIALPTVEFMDLAWILDRKDNGHATVITDVEFDFCGYTSLKCAADSPIRNSSKYYNEATKAVVQARQLVEKERTERQRAIDTLAEELAQSSGLYMTAKQQADRSTVYYMHDKPDLEDSTIVWKLTANALGISTDGGRSYPYGLDVTGTAILSRIYAIGINASYINSGTISANLIYGGELSLGGEKNGNGRLSIKDAENKEVGYIDNTGVHFNQGAFSGTLSAATGTFNGSVTTVSGDYKTTVANGRIDVYYKNVRYGGILPIYEEGSPRYYSFLGDETGCGAISIGIGNHGYIFVNNGANPNERTQRIQIIGPSVIEGDTTILDTLYIKDIARIYPGPGQIGIIPAYGNEAYIASTDEKGATYYKFRVSESLIQMSANLDMHNFQILNASDERLKMRIQPSPVNALSVINDIGVYSYDWIDDSGHVDAGFVAQQLESDVDADLTDISDGRHSTKDIKLIPYLVKAIQELSAKVDSLETELHGAKKTIKALTRKKWTPNVPDSEKSKYMYLIQPQQVKEREED